MSFSLEKAPAAQTGDGVPSTVAVPGKPLCVPARARRCPDLPGEAPLHRGAPRAKRRGRGKSHGHATGETRPRSRPRAASRRAPRGRSTHKVSSSSLAAPSKVSLCRFWNVSQRSRCSPRSSAAAEDAGVPGAGGGSSGSGSPGPASWARGDDCLGRGFAARLRPPAGPAGRRARVSPEAEAAAAAAGALEAPGRFCPRGSEDALLRARRMAPADWRAGLAARASPQPRARP